ncbi:MAG: hypothetical protein KIT46_08630 [Anaerolineales bacterium]|nr:hypothetical protein [Anaerolineales bacterium]MCW5856095.1 hypothetical protein [Anaerolineales bacterium]
MLRLRSFALLAALCLAACTPLSSQTLPTPVVSLPTVGLPTLPGFPAIGSLPPPTASPSPSLTPGGPTPTPLPDYSGRQVTVLHFCPRGEPFGLAYSGWSRALEERSAALNAAGGLLGAELVLVRGNADGPPEQTGAELGLLLDRHPQAVLALICDPASEAALADGLAEAGLPALGPGAFGGDTLFPLEPDPQTQLDFALQALLAQWPSLRPQGAGPELRLALLTWPADVAGELALSPAPLPTPAPTGDGTALPVLVEPHLNLVLQAELDADPFANVFDFVFAAREAHANVIYTNARGFGLAALLNALHDLGVRDRFVLVAPAAAYNLQLYEYLADPARAQGLYLTSAWDWWNQSQQADLQAWAAETEFLDWGALHAAGALDLTQHVLEQVMLEQGLDSLTAVRVQRSLRELRGYAILDGLSQFGQGQAQGLRLWQVGEVLGEMQPVYPPE